MKTKNCETYFNIIDQLKDYFSQHIKEFALMAEDADAYNGCLGDDRLYPMPELNKLYVGMSPIYILEKAFFGYTWSPDFSIELRHSIKFNPNFQYFFIDSCSNLVSVPGCYYESYYLRFIDRDHIESIFEAWLNSAISYDLDDELYTLFVALSGFED